MNTTDLATYLAFNKAIMDRLEFISDLRGHGWYPGERIDFDNLDTNNPESYVEISWRDRDDDMVSAPITLADLLATDESHIAARKARLAREEEERQAQHRLEVEQRALRERAKELATLCRLMAKYPEAV
jgi:hypothetical protein